MCRRFRPSATKELTEKEARKALSVVEIEAEAEGVECATLHPRQQPGL